jgi:hypothetical protein
MSWRRGLGLLKCVIVLQPEERPFHDEVATWSRQQRVEVLCRVSISDDGEDYECIIEQPDTLPVTKKKRREREEEPMTRTEFYDTWHETHQ